MADRKYATTGRSGRALHAVAEVWSRSACGIPLDGPNRLDFDRIPPSRTFCERCGRSIAARTDELSRHAGRTAAASGERTDRGEGTNGRDGGRPTNPVEDQGPFGDSGAAI